MTEAEDLKSRIALAKLLQAAVDDPEQQDDNLIIHREAFCITVEDGVTCACKPFKVPVKEVGALGAHVVVDKLWPHVSARRHKARNYKTGKGPHA